MAVFNIPFNEEFRGMVIDVMKHVRRQQYTPEMLCEHQKILECMYFYWWSMDMKKEEYATELFDDDFEYWNGRARNNRQEEAGHGFQVVQPQYADHAHGTSAHDLAPG